MERPLTEALTYMQDIVGECRSAVTSEIIVTVLAEQTCNWLDLWEGGAVPEWVYDMAYDVANDRKINE